MKSQMTDLAVVAKCAGRAASGLITCAAPADSASSDERASSPNPEPVLCKNRRRETDGCAKKCPNSFDINKLIQAQQRLTKILQRQLTSIGTAICLPLFLQEFHRVLQLLRRWFSSQGNLI